MWRNKKIANDRILALIGVLAAGLLQLMDAHRVHHDLGQLHHSDLGSLNYYARQKDDKRVGVGLHPHVLHPRLRTFTTM